MHRSQRFPRERVLSFTQKSGDCWLWIGEKSGSYGKVWYQGQQRWAHRVVYELFNGPIPATRPRLVVAHRCDVPLCVNPEHLFLCTDAENQWDSMSKGRKKRVKK